MRRPTGRLEEAQMDANSAEHLQALTAAGHRPIRAASWLSTASGLVWIPQAFVIASVVGGLAADPVALPGWRPPALFALLAALRVVLSSLASHFAYEGAVAVKRSIRSRLIERFASWSPLDPARPSSGAAASLGADHVEALEPYLSRYEPARARLMVIPIAILVVSAVYSWLAALILLVAGPLIPVFMAIIGMRAKEASDRQLAAMLGINVYLADRLGGLQDLRILRAEARAGEQLETHAFDLKRATMAVLRIAFLSSAVLELFAALGVAFVAVYIGFHLLGYFAIGTWGAPLGLREGLFILILAPDFFAPLRDFAATYHDKAAALAAADALAPVLEGEREELPGTIPAAASVARGGVVLDRVTYAYGRDGRAAIDDMSLTVAPGESVALTGPSGIGKTTVLGLVGGLAAPSSGSVSHGSPTPRIAWIGQSPHFLSTTLRNNLTLGRAGMDDAALEQAIAEAGAADVLARLPAGLSTVLGESAQGLSGGEAQRMALARAILADADIILADEPTAHLDSDTASRVTESLLTLARGKTLVVATHDPALARRMDRIVPILAREGALA